MALHLTKILLIGLAFLSLMGCSNSFDFIVPGVSLCGKLDSNLTDLALADHDQKLYVTDSDGERILVISTKSMTIQKTIITPDSNNHVAASPDGEKVYVISQGERGSRMLVVGVSTDNILESIFLGSGSAKGLSISGDNTAALIKGDYKTTILDLVRKNHRVLHGEVASAKGTFIQTGSDNSYYYLGAYHNDTGHPVRDVPEGVKVTSLATSSDRSVFVERDDGDIHHEFSRLIFRNGDDFSTRAIFPVGRYPKNLMFSANGMKFYADGGNIPPEKMKLPSLEKQAPGAASYMTIINVPTLTIDRVIPYEGIIGPAVMSADGKRVYFLSFQVDFVKKEPIFTMLILAVDTEIGQITHKISVPSPKEIRGKSCDY